MCYQWNVHEKRVTNQAGISFNVDRGTLTALSHIFFELRIYQGNILLK